MCAWWRDNINEQHSEERNIVALCGSRLCDAVNVRKKKGLLWLVKENECSDCVGKRYCSGVRVCVPSRV